MDFDVGLESTGGAATVVRHESGDCDEAVRVFSKGIEHREERLQLNRLVEERVGTGIEARLAHGVSRVVGQDGDALMGLSPAAPIDDAKPVAFL
jgi:hypothetical protein